MAWAIEKSRGAERLRQLAEGRREPAALVALTAVLALVILLGRFRYGLLNVLFVLAAFA